MSEFTLYMMLIFLPGIIAYKVFDELTEHREHKVHEVIIFAFLFGCLSYFTYYLFVKIVFIITGYSIMFYLPDVLKDPSKASYSEIFIASCLAVFVGFGCSAFDNKKLLHKLAYRIHVTRKHGEMDTFTFLLNSTLREDAWIIVRDKEDNLAYYGWVHTYSAGHEKNELFLVDVTVYDNTTGEELMKTQGIYLSKPKEKYIFEFPTIKTSDTITNNS